MGAAASQICYGLRRSVRLGTSFGMNCVKRELRPSSWYLGWPSPSNLTYQSWERSMALYGGGMDEGRWSESEADVLLPFCEKTTRGGGITDDRGKSLNRSCQGEAGLLCCTCCKLASLVVLLCCRSSFQYSRRVTSGMSSSKEGDQRGGG